MEGFLKLRKEKGARYGWGKKLHAVVKNSKFYLFEKSSEQDNVDKAIFSASLKFLFFSFLFLFF